MIIGIEYIAQGLAIYSALLAGYHDGPAIRVFHEKGWESEKKNKQFHLSGATYRGLVVFLLALMPSPDLQNMAFTGGSSFLWVYMVFDISCGIWGHSGHWDYLGKNDWHGRAWFYVFGKNAGRWKVAIVLSVLIIINYLKITAL